MFKCALSTYTFKIRIFFESYKNLGKSRKLWKIKKILSFQEFLSTFSEFPRIYWKSKKFGSWTRDTNLINGPKFS